MKLSILYRGPLSSCNYGCRYCPFAKRRDSREDLEKDRIALERFVGWAAGRTADRLSILFTPWGEALVRRWYRIALGALTRIPHIEKAAVQTNLSSGLEWLDGCDTSRLALWCSFHPTEVARPRFLARCRELDRRGVRFSVGVVGLKEHEDEIRALRAELPPHVYLWINAYRSRPDYYREEDLARLERIDPHFRMNHRNHRSAGQPCAAGETVVSVDGDGTLRRCHFIQEPIGNIYGTGIEAALSPRACTRARCTCHIGYVHMEHLGLGRVFGDGVLERIPAGWDLPGHQAAK